MTNRTALLAPLLSAMAIAQLPVGPEAPRGPWATIAQALTLPNNQGEIRRKFAGDQSTFPQPLGAPPPGVPDFRKNVLFGPNHAWVEIDAISTGNDRIPLSGFTLTTNPAAPTGWVNFVFCVTAGTNDLTQNGVVSERVAANGHASGDVFSTFSKDSDSSSAEEGIPIELIDRAMLEHGFEHIGLSSSNTILGLDPFLPLIAAGWHGTNLPELLTFTHYDPTTGVVSAKLYFSVTHASAAAINQNAPTWIGQLPARGLCAADILEMSWSGTAWSAPTIYRTAENLGLTQYDDVTSLAVDGLVGPTVLFTPATNGGELTANKIVGSTGYNNGVVRNLDGTPVRLVRAGDVNAIGSYDPELAQFHRAHGVPVAMRTVQPKFGLSVAADQFGTGFHVMMSGWPGARSSGRLNLYVSRDGSNWVLLDGPISRTSRQHNVHRYYATGTLLYAPSTWVRAEFTTGTGTTTSSWAVKLEQ